MHKIERMLELTEREIPWALARFNDGEMKAMHKAEGFVARGDQPCTADLAALLRWALAQRAHNLFTGVPCGTCWPEWRFKADQTVGKLETDFKTLAVVQTNRNLIRFKTTMGKLLAKRRVVWISGEDQDVTKLPFLPKRGVSVPTKDAYTESRDYLFREATFHPGEVVCLSCGPLATVAAVKLFLANPETTFIDVGSVWDPETRGVSHACHDGTLKKCGECN